MSATAPAIETAHIVLDEWSAITCRLIERRCAQEALHLEPD